MLAASIAASLALFSPQDQESGLFEPVEVRALVVRLSDLDVLGEPARIGDAMQRLHEIGFDAVVPMAWERGRTLTNSAALTAFGLPDTCAFPGRDVLQEIVFEAHRAGLEVLIGLDGTLAVDPNAKLAAAIPLTATRDRLDPRDAGVRKAARAFATELARAAEIDGFVLCNGLTAFTTEEARDPATKSALDAARAEFVAWRAELREIDRELAVGWAANDAKFAGPSDPNGLDFAAFSAGTKGFAAPMAKWLDEKPGRAATWRVLDEKLDADTFTKALADARTQPFQGEFLASFATLIGRDGLLTDVLTEGLDAPYYARATLPWRSGVTWRPAAELVPLVNDSGTFTQLELDIPSSRLEAGLHGAASWAMKPLETGPHDLWVYFPPSVTELPALKFVVPIDPRRTVRIEHPAGIPRGWTRIGRVHVGSLKMQDVLRLDIKEGGERAIEIGALVALPVRR